MMDQLVVLVDLKDESVVDTVSAEYLHGEACREQYEAYDRCKVVRIFACIYLSPVVIPICRRANRKEQEEAEENEAPSAEERDQVGVFPTDLVVLSVKLELR